MDRSEKNSRENMESERVSASGGKKRKASLLLWTERDAQGKMLQKWEKLQLLGTARKSVSLASPGREKETVGALLEIDGKEKCLEILSGQRHRQRTKGKRVSLLDEREACEIKGISRGGSRKWQGTATVDSAFAIRCDARPNLGARRVWVGCPLLLVGGGKRDSRSILEKAT